MCKHGIKRFFCFFYHAVIFLKDNFEGLCFVAFPFYLFFFRKSFALGFHSRSHEATLLLSQHSFQDHFIIKEKKSAFYISHENQTNQVILDIDMEVCLSACVLLKLFGNKEKNTSSLRTKKKKKAPFSALRVFCYWSENVLLRLHSHSFAAGSQLLPLHGHLCFFLRTVWTVFSCRSSASGKLIGYSAGPRENSRL